MRNRTERCLLIAILVMLSGCIHKDDGTPDEKKLRSHLFRHIDAQVQQSHYPFTLSVPPMRLEGQQQGKDWLLESQDSDGKERIRVRKEGSDIFLVRGKQKEKLTARQFGLLSPRDHLLLVKSSGLQIEPLSKNKRGLIGVRVVLSSEEIGDRLGKWIGSTFDQGSANQASRKFRIRYQLWYPPHQEGISILKLEIHPQAKDQPHEKMVYRFGKP